MFTFLNDTPLMAVICWVILLGSVVVIYISKLVGKAKYRGQELDIDADWYEKSQAQYGNRNDACLYYFHHDKNFFHQGHLMENKSHTVVYEAKFLYNNVIGNDEVDFINHIIGYTHHHKVGHSVSSNFGTDNIGITLDSYFNFDGVNIWNYLSSKGYSYKFNNKGLTYTVDIYKQDLKIGTIYSSNNGKNFFNSDGSTIVPKIGGSGICIVECNIKDIDAMFLYAMAFARTELSSNNLRRKKK